MQQTNQYQLNLIETSDTFSPAPLNENAQKLEAALAAVRAETAAGDAAEAATRAAADAALDQRVAMLEVHRIVTGFHLNTGIVDLGFTPAVVFVVGSHGYSFVIQGRSIDGLKIVEGGFEHTGYFDNCRYVALL